MAGKRGQVTMTLDEGQVIGACRAYVERMFDAKEHVITLRADPQRVNVDVTISKRRAPRKAKAPAPVKAAA